MSDREQRLAQLTPLQRAVLALKETQQRLEQLEQRRDQPIAIVGMACRFPGGANSAETYWQHLCAGLDAIQEIPAERWDVDAYYDPDPAAPGKMNTRWGGFIRGIDEFDNHFFSISDREATRIDPQHRLALELTWEALEDAGLPPSSLRGSRTGVFLGLSHSEYGIMLSTDMAQSDAYVSTGTAHCLAANRVSFAYDFHGPSVVLDTACSSSLVAVHLACQSIRTGDAELAVAGGVNIILSPLATVNLTKAGFSAADGRVRAFDASATGYVRSEGAGMLVLKPLAAALRDRDPIYAVIRGTAINQNGFSNGLTAPSRPAQESVLRAAYAAAKVSPGQVQYVETQGTGTRLGDAIEALSLGEVLKEGRPAESRCKIGSVKTNIGHLEAASGAASLMKVALALHHQQIPGTRNFQTPSPDIPFDKLPLTVQSQLEAWPAAPQKLAGVSAFGFGGSNAHIVLAEAPQAAGGIPADAPRATLFPVGSAADSATATTQWLTLSARTESALRALATTYSAWLKAQSPADWADICWTAAARRDHHDCRLAVQAASPAEAAERLAAYLSNGQADGVLSGRKPYGREPKVALAFGASPLSDATKVASLTQLPDWSSAIADIDSALHEAAGYTLSSVLQDAATWSDATRGLPATVALQLTLANWWRRAGVTPSVVAGGAAGELTSAVLAGVLSAAEALKLAVRVGRGETLASRDITQLNAAKLPCVLATDGRVLAGPDWNVQLWQSSLSRELDWTAALAVLARRQVDVVLDIDGVIATATKQVPGVIHVNVVDAGGSSSTAWFEAIRNVLGRVYVTGVTPRWNRLGSIVNHHVALPTYPWQKHRLWADRKNWLANAHGGGVAGNVAEAATVSSSVALAGVAHGAAGAGVAQLTQDASSGDSIATETIRVRPELNTPFEGPRTPLEADLVQAWRDILKLDRVGIHDNFFELGGDSLQAMMLQNSLQDRIGEVVHGYVLFQSQTVHLLADYLRRYYPAQVRKLHPAEQCSEVAEVPAAPTSVGPAEVDQVRQLMERLSPLPPYPAVTKPRNRRALFVLSPPRSGSTLLRVMLAGHPQLFSPPELELACFPTMLARRQAYEGVPGQWLEGVIRMTMEACECDVEEARRIVGQYEDEGKSVQEFYRFIQERLGERILVDKTPSYSGRIEYLQRAEELFDEPYYVHLLRHPCGMMRSYVDYKMHEAFKMRFAFGVEVPFTPYQMAELTWDISHENIHNFLQQVPSSRQLRLRFEDVVRQPEQQMRRLCDFLNLEYRDDMIHPYDNRDKKMLNGVVAADRMYGDQKFIVKHRDIDPKVADEWRAHLQADILGSVARNLALEFGYDDVGGAKTNGVPAAAADKPVRNKSAAQDSATQAAQLLGELDQLSDDEVESLLQQHMMDEA